MTVITQQSYRPKQVALFPERGLENVNEYREAVYSADKVYRHLLRIWWDHKRSTVCFVCLNPSTATHVLDDRTTAKLKSYAFDWGYGGYRLVNIFDIRSTNPLLLYSHSKPCSDVNDDYIVDAVRSSSTVVCAWGNHGQFSQRGAQVREMILKHKRTLHCFKITNVGQPVHPLYLKQDTTAVVWR